MTRAPFCVSRSAQLPSARCIMAGDGSLRAPLEALIDRIGSERTRLVGARHTQDLQQIVASADVFVSSSTVAETFGLAPLEAAAAGVPVVAFARGGMGEFLCDGANALIPSAPTPRALAAAMVGVLSNATRATAMGATASRVATRFSQAATSERYAELYQRTYAAMVRRRIANAPKRGA